MKLIKSNITKLFILIGISVIVGFTIYQSVLVQEEKELIIGTWLANNDVTNKMIFTSDGICKREFEGVITDEFTYMITSEVTSKGNELTNLQLTTVISDFIDTGEVVNYSINSLDNQFMTLEITEPKHNFIEYTKE